MPRLPRHLEKAAVELAAQTTPALRSMPLFQKVASNERNRPAIVRAWRAFLSSLYSDGHLRKLPPSTGDAVEPVKRGKKPHPVVVELRKLVESDATDVIHSFMRDIACDGYTAGVLLAMFKGAAMAPMGTPEFYYSAFSAIAGSPGLRWFVREIDERLPDDGTLVPVAPETYASVAFSIGLTVARDLDTTSRADVKILFRNHLAVLAASIASVLALYRCAGLRVTGVVEALMLRSLARSAAIDNRVSSWWQWLTSPRPVAVANQLDRLAAMERLFFQAFVAVRYAAQQVKRVAPDGCSPIADGPLVLMARTHPRVDLFLNGAGEVEGNMAWLLATRAPQAAWLEAALSGKDVEPVQRWRERWEAGDEDVKAALASLAPRATQLQLEADRFAAVLDDWAPLLRGAVCCDVQQAPMALTDVPAMLAAGDGDRLTVSQAMQALIRAQDAMKRIPKVVPQGVEVVSDDPLVEKFFSALEKAASGGAPVDVEPVKRVGIDVRDVRDMPAWVRRLMQA